MAKGSFFAGLKGFDAYAKTLEDIRIKTSGGGLVTLISLLCIATLLITEFVAFRNVELKAGLLVDKSRKQKLGINMDITFPRVPCYLLSIDLMDIAGEHQDELSHDMYKTRLSPDGQPIIVEKQEKVNTRNDTNGLTKAPECGSCYGGDLPPSGCCNTCEDVRLAYKRRGWSFSNPDAMEQCVREGWTEKIKSQAGEGCNVRGHLEVSKVSGNFHIAPGSSFSQGGMHVHDFQPYLDAKFDFSHDIHYFVFGERFDGAVNPLDSLSKRTDEPNHTFTYYAKVVGTKIMYRSGAVLHTNQYSVTQYEQKGADARVHLPGFFLNYEISPLTVTLTETRPPLSQFVTGAFSIVGGIFTVAGLVDSALYRAEKSLRKKMQLGKAS